MFKKAERLTLAEFLRKQYLGQHLATALGRCYFDFMAQGFAPELTWLDLSEEQRCQAQGFVRADLLQVPMHPPRLLPRQEPTRARLAVGTVELERDGQGMLVLKHVKLGIFKLKEIVQQDRKQRLHLSTPGCYRVMRFDTSDSRDALLEAFDREVKRIAKASPAYSDSALRSWASKSGPSEFRAKPNEMALIAAEDPAFALLIISAYHVPSRVRAVFHTQLKQCNFKKWHPACVRFWKSQKRMVPRFPRNPDGGIRLEVDNKGCLIQEMVATSRFDPRKHLPPPAKQPRSAQLKVMALGLAANDIVVSGEKLGKQNPRCGPLLTASAKIHALKNAQRSANRRLAELDKEAGRLDKILNYWLEKAHFLQHRDFFNLLSAEINSED